MNSDRRNFSNELDDNSLPWPEVWYLAAFRPSEANYKRIAADPQAGITLGVMWMVLGALLAYAISLLINWALTGSPSITGEDQFKEALGLGFTTDDALLISVCWPMVLIVITPISLLFYASVTHIAARLMDADDAEGYIKMVYVIAAYRTPIVVGLCWVQVLPLFPALLINFPVAIYMIGLNIVAAKAVYDFDRWDKAVFTGAAAAVLSLLFMGVCLFVTMILAALSGAV